MEEQADLFTHIHPRESGRFGGSFSVDDFENGFAKYDNILTYRAVAKEGTYSIHKTTKFKKKQFLEYVRRQNEKLDTKYDAIYKTNKQKYGSVGNYDYDKWRKANSRAFNNKMIELHNVYLAGQSKYGYKYSLEKRDN